MRKSRLLGLALAFVMLTGCGNSSDHKVIDAGALANDLVTQITYDDTLTSQSEDVAEMTFTIEDGVETVYYAGSGSTAEVVAVFTAPNAASADKQEEHVKEYLDEKAESFEDYIPEEKKRIDDNAVTYKSGKYVILCVSNDHDKAEEIIQKAFEE